MRRILLKLKNDLYQIRFGLLALIIYIIITQLLFGTVCPFFILTNFPCPACGLTRATLYLLTGNIEQAIEMNWTVFLWIGLIGALLFERYIKVFHFRIFPTGVIFVCFITFLRYIFVVGEIF